MFMSCEVLMKEIIQIRRSPEDFETENLAFDFSSYKKIGKTKRARPRAQTISIQHTLSHDLESFFWVLLWIVRLLALFHRH